MKALVCCFTKTGTTRRLAEAIAGALPCEKDLLALEAVGDPKAYDVVFVGFPVWEFGVAEPAREFLETRVAGAKLALFVTHAMPSAGEAPVAKLMDRILGRCRKAAVGAEVLGLFHCRGELSAEMADQMEASGNPMLQHFARTRGETLGHPDAAELEQARAFARQTIEGLATASKPGA